MNNREQVAAVQKMQDFILRHIDDDPFVFADLYLLAGYSPRHADRIFKELLGLTPREYVKRIKLSNSSQELLESDKTILEVALKTNFNSHEGYLKAFSNAFGIPPSKYKTGKHPIPLFIPYPVNGYQEHISREERNEMDKRTCLCMITPVQRPKRKLIVMRSQNAHDYWSYCEEKGCDWEGLFNSIPSKLDTAAVLTLPPALMKPGFGNIASGVEVPYEYDGQIPEGCEMLELVPCEMLFFQSQPFTTQDEFFFLIGELFHAVKAFDAARYGYTYADDLAPRFNFGGLEEKGARLAIPVKRREGPSL